MSAALLDFLSQRSCLPATTAELWTDIGIAGAGNGLPGTHEELSEELRLLTIAGRIVCEDGQWRLVPQKVKQEPQKSLF
jgi:hypothetical protein